MVRIVSEVLIPARSGRAVEVKKNQCLRVIDVEGEQVGDMVILNLHDFRERYSAWFTSQLCENLLVHPVLYSNPPFMRPLMSIDEDTVGVHFPSGSRCNRARYEKLGRPGYQGCQEILERTLYPYGIQPHDIPDVFNVFMKVNIYPDGRRQIDLPASKKGDYTDFRANIDCLVGIVACPDDIDPVNNYKCKPLLMQVVEK